MKKILILVLAVVLLFGLLVVCHLLDGKGVPAAEETTAPESTAETSVPTTEATTVPTATTTAPTETTVPKTTEATEPTLSNAELVPWVPAPTVAPPAQTPPPTSPPAPPVDSGNTREDEFPLIPMA